MIQFNLLPDVKIQYVRAQRTKRLVIGTAIIATLASFAIFVLLFVGVQGVQRKLLSDLDGRIKVATNELKSTPELNKILTIQNQLGALTKLHDDKVVATRVFGYLQETTPSDVTISDYEVNFTESTMKITGQAPGLDRVNTFTDTLKFATFATGEDPAGDDKAFSEVVLAQFSPSEGKFAYALTLKYDPKLFQSASEIVLTVPKGLTTTRSVIGQPTDIFKKNPDSVTGTGSN